MATSPKGKRLTRRQINRIRNAFLSGEHTEDIIKTLAISRQTFDYHRKKENWNSLKDKAQEKAKEVTIGKLQRKFEREINITDGAIGLMGLDIKRKIETKQVMDFNAHAYKELVELKGRLIGEPIDQMANEPFKLPDQIVVTIENGNGNSGSKTTRKA